jgi:hypothetical protein
MQYEPTQYEPTQYEPTQYEPTQYEPTQYEPTQYEPLPYDPLASTHPADNYLSPRFAPNGLGLDTQSFNGFAVNASSAATDETGSRFGSDELWSGPADHSSGLDPLESSSDGRSLSAFGQPDTTFSAFGRPDATPFSAFGQPDPGFDAFGRPDSQEDPGRNGRGLHDMANLGDTGYRLNDLGQNVNDVGHGREDTAHGPNVADAAFGRPGPSPAWPQPSRLDPSRTDIGRTGRDVRASEFGRLDPGSIGQMGQPDHWPTDWPTDTTTTFSGRAPVSPAPTATGPLVPVSTPPVPPASTLVTPSAPPAIPPIGQAPTVPLANALPLVPAYNQPPAAHIPDWTEIEIPGEDDEQIVPWDRKPLMIVIVAGVILVLLGIASGVAASKIFYPGQTVTSWHPAQPANSPPK